jgi:hypothetical protein
MSMDPNVGSVATWRKSRHSVTNGNCVEATADSNGITIRDSVNRAGAAIRYSAQAWRAFLAHAKVGRYDLTADLPEHNRTARPYLQSCPVDVQVRPTGGHRRGGWALVIEPRAEIRERRATIPAAPALRASQVLDTGQGHGRDAPQWEPTTP